MKSLSPDNKTPVKQRVLETTLVAVRDKKHRQRQNRITTMISISSILIITLLLLVTHFSTSHNGQAVSVASPPPSNTPPSNLSHNMSLEVSMAMNGDIRTVMLSPSDLAEIIFDPNFKFIKRADSYTWKSKSTLIYMNMPTTSLPITDTSYDTSY